ncbi:MAG TPA: hypothetical protein VGN51_24170 [Acidimicrobiia bacterium]
MRADAVDEIRSIATIDEQVDLSAEEGTDSALLDLAGVALRVDGEHTCWPDDEMVDVRSRAPQPSVVQDHGAVAQFSFETLSDALLTRCALSPRLRRLWLVGHGEQQAAEFGMASFDVFCALGAPPLILPPGRSTSNSRQPVRR